MLNGSLLKRLGVFITVIVSVLVIFVVVNVLRFSPQTWLTAQLGDQLSADFQGEFSSTDFGTSLHWQDLETRGEHFTLLADTVQLKFNLISVAIGKPSVQQLTLESPFIEFFGEQPSVQLLRPLIQFGSQQIDLTQGVILFNDTEMSSVELSLIKNGVFGEYAAQLSSTLYHQDANVNLSASTLIGIDGNDQLVLAKNQFETQLNLPNWQGRLVGKIKSIFISPDNDAQFKFVSWSSAWQTKMPNLPNALDWAGGLTSGTYRAGDWQVSTFDSALAYVDQQNIGHTFAVQSNESEFVAGDLIGQLGLSLLTEYPAGMPLKSYNLVLSGLMLPNKPVTEWTNPDIRLSMIDSENVQQTHFIKTRSFTLNADQNRWQLNDGDWHLIANEQPAGDFGFGDIIGHWPSLTIQQAPTVAERLQPAFDIVAPDLEVLHALFNQLVP